jgi:hypothetical protein
LYDEFDPAERARFEEHLSTCAECYAALDAMRAVRVQLATWQLPENAGVGAGPRIGAAHETAAVPSGGYTRPWWAPGALAAAAVILLALGAAIANLEITYGRDGISLRTGWSRTPADTKAVAALSPSQSSGARRVEAQAVSSADLAALEQRLRTEFHALAASTSAPSAATAPANPAGSASANAEVIRRVQDLIDQSEARQRRELALRVAQVVRDFDTQRQTDLVRIQQGLGQIEGSSAADRQILNYLVRVSQRQK